MISRDPFLVSPHMTLIYQTRSDTTIWLGDYSAALDTHALQKFGIRAVLTVAAELDLSYPLETGIRHKIVPVLDMASFKIRPYLSECRSFILEAMARKQNILVHCATGISRSAAIVVAFLMQKLNLTFKRAYTLVKNKRHLIDPNYGFKDELVQYENKILGLKSQAVRNKQSQPLPQPMQINYISEYLSEQRNKESNRLQEIFGKRGSKNVESKFIFTPKARGARMRFSSVHNRSSFLPSLELQK